MIVFSYFLSRKACLIKNGILFSYESPKRLIGHTLGLVPRVRFQWFRNIYKCLHIEKHNLKQSKLMCIFKFKPIECIVF